MDEPNANLDAEGELALSRAIAHMKALGKTIVFVTHKTNLLAFADKIMIMQNGTVTQIGDRDDILSRLIANNAPPQLQLDLGRE